MHPTNVMAATTGLGSPSSSLYNGARGGEDIYFPQNRRGGFVTKGEIRDPWEMEKQHYTPQMRGVEEEMKGGFFVRR